MSKTTSISYSNGEQTHSAERILSKKELIKIFPNSDTVSLSIRYRKSFYTRKSGSSGGEGSKSKKKGYGQSSRDKSYSRSKVINLHGFNDKKEMKS